MTSSVGQINFGVGVDATGTATRLELAVKPAVAAVQRELNRNPLKVKLKVDFDRFALEAQLREVTRNARKIKLELELDKFGVEAQLREITRNSRKVKIDFELNLTEEQLKRLRSAATAIGKLDSKTIKLTFDSNITEAQVKLIRSAASAIKRLESKNVAVNFASTLTEDQVKALRSAASAIRRLDNKHITVRVDIIVDEARLRALAEVLRNLRDRNLRVGVNADKGPVDRLAASLGSLTKYAGVGALITAGLAAITGAAGLAAGAIGGLVVGVAALGPALAAIGATAAVGLSGVADTFQAMSAMTENAAADARAQSKAVASANKSLASATNSAASAQRSLDDAQVSAADAAEAVGDAYKTAEQRLADYQTTLAEASLDEREAALNLAEARKELSDPESNKTELDRQRNILRVERAEIALGKAQKANLDLNAQAQEDLAKGVEGSTEVTAARKNQKQADDAVTDAERNLAAATEAVAAATENLATAQAGASSSTDKFNTAMAKLAPNAQAFVLASKAIAPAWAEVRKAVQDELFAGLGEQLSLTAEQVLPRLQEGMTGVAGELNAMATNFLEFTRSAAGMQLLNASFASAENLLRGLGSGTGEFTKGILDLTTTAAPAMFGIGQAIAGIGEGIGRALSDATASGGLTRLLDGFTVALQGLEPLLNGLFDGLIAAGEQVLPALGPLFATLGDVFAQIGPSLGQIGKVFAESLTQLLPYLGDFITALADGLAPVLPVLAKVLGSLFEAVTPLLPVFSDIAVVVGETLADVISALAPALVPLAEAFTSLLEAVAPILPLVAEVVAEVVQALAPALTVIFDALGPVIAQLVEDFRPILKELAPILAEVAMTLAQTLAQALKDLAPLLPGLIKAWSDLVMAIIPILPELAELAAEIIPPLVDIMIALTPIIIKWIELFTWLVSNVIEKLVIPAINKVTELWTWMGDKIETGVNWLTNTVFPALGSALEKVKGWFADAVEWIGNKWDGLKEAASVPVNFVIDTVWNNGLLKAWNSVDNLLGGILPDATPLPLIPKRATGGPLGYLHGGTGNGTADDMLFWGSNYEHVITASEVMAAGGQNVIYAIRDMISRGIPFTWDHGKLITDLGRDNLDRYGAAVKQKGYGNVPPEGLFDSLARVPIPQFQDGGQIFPWMYQLQKGHEFAKAQDGRNYQWAGPRFNGDSFDCSGFMGSVIAAIQGTNVWQRYWATPSFAGYPSVGAQGLTKGLLDGVGMVVGITDDPGGPGGGHTAGELRGIPELGISPARVESGGAIGNVHYGRGTNPLSFASLYGLPIGANGFFQPTPGGSSNGPSVGEQNSFITSTIEKMVKVVTDPVRDQILSTFGAPPPQIKALPTSILDASEKAFVNVSANAVGGLGGLVGGVWQRAQDVGSKIRDLIPFDSGGIASGTGFMPKDIIAPERVLNPEQTQLFEALVVALQKLATGGFSAAGQAVSAVTVDLSQASVEALRTGFSLEQQLATENTEHAIERTATSQEEVAAREAAAQREQLLNIASKLGGDVLGPIMASAVDAGVGVLNSWISGLGDEIVKAVNGTTKAVNNLGDKATDPLTAAAPPAFGQPGSAFDFGGALAAGVTQVANAATAAFERVRDDIVNAALAQTPSRVGQSRGRLGEDISGGYLTDLIVRLTGVEIEILDLLENTYEEIQSFREGAFTGFTETGELISDTAALVQRNQSSIELAASEQERIQKALIKSVLKYLITAVLIPIITAILGAMITVVTTAIGAAIGSVVPVIGTALGAAVGAAVGAGLAGLAAVFTSLLAVGAGAAIDAFDSGGLANGTGFMPKNIIGPERVLSERQTSSFERLVEVLDRGGNRTIQIGSMNVSGRDAAQKTADNLLSLIST